MAKKVAPLRLKSHRDELRKNCSKLISSFEGIRIHLNVGQAATIALREQIHSSDTYSSLTGSVQNFKIDSLTVSDILVLIQAGLIQEWNIFLDSIFCAVVLYYLEINDPSRLPSQTFDLNRIKPDSLPRIRESISDAVKESFSFKPYDQKIETLRNIFGIANDQSLDYELKKHVAIRNIFQHHRGIIRESDLIKIGRRNLEILDENNMKKQYNVGERVELKLSEISYLNEAIGQYSKKFEVLK